MIGWILDNLTDLSSWGYILYMIHWGRGIWRVDCSLVRVVLWTRAGAAKKLCRLQVGEVWNQAGGGRSLQITYPRRQHFAQEGKTLQGLCQRRSPPLGTADSILLFLKRGGFVQWSIWENWTTDLKKKKLYSVVKWLILNWFILGGFIQTKYVKNGFKQSKPVLLFPTWPRAQQEIDSEQSKQGSV